MSATYPAGENYTDLAAVSFLEALQDASMVQPNTLGTAALFPAPIYDIRLGGDAAMVGSDRQITLPIAGVIITIGRPYGIECGYAGDVYSDQDIWIPFSVWSQTNASEDDTEQRLLFARNHRQNVFSNYGLSIQVTGATGAKPRGESPITSLAVVDYRWRFFYSRA